jgi:predicted DNA-binding protein with PD1-like motif
MHGCFGLPLFPNRRVARFARRPQTEMKAKKLEGGKQRTFVVVLATGEEVMQTLLSFSDQHELRGAHFTAIGAFSRVRLGYWRWQTKSYEPIDVPEQVEVLSLSGNIAWAGNERKVHAHVVVGKADGGAHGGHLLEGEVRPTLEVIVTESPETLRRTVDAETGLPLLDLGFAPPLAPG